MTYPPQQPGPYGDPYPQQPDPYEQQSYGQPDPYGQQYRGQQGQFRSPGFGVPPPPPPKKNKMWVWAALSAGAVAVVALLVTGFAAPGFFLSDGDDESSGSGAKALAKALASALQEQDESAVLDLVCESADDSMKEESPGRPPDVTDYKVEVVSVGQTSDTTATAKIRVSGKTQGKSFTAIRKFQLEQERDDWCLMDVAGAESDASSSGDSDPSYRTDMPSSESGHSDY